MKLKTLKELQKPIRNDEGNCIRIEELKAEAIKWVKEDLKEAKEYSEYTQQELIIKAYEWMKRFNLSEGDLK